MPFKVRAAMFRHYRNYGITMNDDEKRLDPRVEQIAGVIWRTYEIAFTGQAPTAEEWERRVGVWKMQSIDSANNQFVSVAIAAALAVAAVDPGLELLDER